MPSYLCIYVPCVTYSQMCLSVVTALLKYPCLLHHYCTDPFDTIKARLQVQDSGPGRPVTYRGTAHAFLKVVMFLV